MSRVLTIEKFEDKARLTPDNRYNYSMLVHMCPMRQQF